MVVLITDYEKMRQCHVILDSWIADFGFNLFGVNSPQLAAWFDFAHHPEFIEG